MQQYPVVRSPSKRTRRRTSSRSINKMCTWGMVFVIALSILACSLLGSEPLPAARRIVRLATLTPTPLLEASPIRNADPTTIADTDAITPTRPLAQPSLVAKPIAEISGVNPLPTLTPTLAQIPISNQSSGDAGSLAVAPSPSPPNPATPPAASAATPTSIPNPENVGWSFAGVQTYPDPYGGGLMLYGELINDTGVTQELSMVTGTFYNDQHQVIADANSTIDYWPVDVIPPGGRLPFELTILDIENAADYDLVVEAQPSNRISYQGFEFSAINQRYEEDSYCLEGTLQNLGGPLEQYVLIVAVLFDAQDRVIKFGEFYEPVSGNQPLDFEICVDLVSQNVARHELRAWGE